MKLRDYQLRAVAGVEREWDAGKRAPLCVLPTGGGKTAVAIHLIRQTLPAPVLFLVHTRDLLEQTISKLREEFGANIVDSVHNRYATIRVGTVQSLTRMSADARPPAKLVVLDEAHHYIAERWGEVAEHYSRARIVGLTATPERGDGKPLGDLFDAIVVGATYSELLKAGYLVDCEVIRPPREAELSGSELACSPVAAYEKHAAGTRAFFFASSVPEATRWQREFAAQGFASGIITANTPKHTRANQLAALGAGRIQVLCNVTCLTEGIDVPSVETIILGRGCENVAQFLQIVGRGLRPYPGKRGALLLDLTGATWRHGMPTADREYSLTGDGITLSEPGALRTCPKCGYTELSKPVCSGCGFVYPTVERKPPRVYAWELTRANTQEMMTTAGGAQLSEYNRLRETQRENGYDCYWVIAQYKARYGKVIFVHDATTAEKRAQLLKFRNAAQAKGYKPGQAKYRYKQTFGQWPTRG